MKVQLGKRCVCKNYANDIKRGWKKLMEENVIE